MKPTEKPTKKVVKCLHCGHENFTNSKSICPGCYWMNDTECTNRRKMLRNMPLFIIPSIDEIPMDECYDVNNNKAKKFHIAYTPIKQFLVKKLSEEEQEQIASLFQIKNPTMEEIEEIQSFIKLGNGRTTFHNEITLVKIKLRKSRGFSFVFPKQILKHIKNLAKQTEIYLWLYDGEKLIEVFPHAQIISYERETLIKVNPQSNISRDAEWTLKIGFD